MTRPYAIHLYIVLYALYTPKYLYIPSYTPIYINIFNIRKLRANIKHKSGHNSGPRASPRVSVSRGSGTPKGVKIN